MTISLPFGTRARIWTLGGKSNEQRNLGNAPSNSGQNRTHEILFSCKLLCSPLYRDYVFWVSSRVWGYLLIPICATQSGFHSHFRVWIALRSCNPHRTQETEERLGSGDR